MDLFSYLLGKQAGGGGGGNLQEKSVTITQNTTTNITPDEGYDGLSKVNVTTNVASDMSEYFVTQINSNIEGTSNAPIFLKKMPTVTIASNVQHLNYMFASLPMQSLESIQGFDTNITYCSWMFNYCEKLTSINTTGWNTSNVIDMSGMFSGCSSLQTLDLSGFDTSNVTNMTAMFRYCSSLTHLDIRNFTFKSGVSTNVMFASVPANCEIIVKSQTEKDFILNIRSDFTNVKTVAEL